MLIGLTMIVTARAVGARDEGLELCLLSAADSGGLTIVGHSLVIVQNSVGSTEDVSHSAGFIN